MQPTRSQPSHRHTDLCTALIRPPHTGIMATMKHFVDNNQEQDRRLVSADVPQRAQWEIYYPAFAAGVAAGVAAVMCSYNRINSTYACQNAQTLSDLKVRRLAQRMSSVEHCASCVASHTNH